MFAELLNAFHKLYHFDELIRWGGHLVLIAVVFSETGLMAGFFLPGDSLLVTAGLFAAAGTLNVWLLLGELMIAAIIGDSVSYAVGRRLGPRLFTREDSLLFHRNHLARTEHFYERYGSKTIVLARFVPIVRTFAPVVAGIGRMRYRTFVVYNIVGGVAWVLLTVMAGYTLGRTIPNIDKHVHKIILAVIFLSLVPIVVDVYRNRRRSAP